MASFAHSILHPCTLRSWLMSVCRRSVAYSEGADGAPGGESHDGASEWSVPRDDFPARPSESRRIRAMRSCAVGALPGDDEVNALGGEVVGLSKV